MKTKKIIKMAVDLIMTAGLLFMMAYMLTGQKLHEYAGAGMFALFITHNLLNLRWYGGLLRGRYTALRIARTAVNLAVLLCMLGLMVSGIMMSRHVFGFLSIRSGMSFARSLHMLSAYWGFVLMSVHLGMHWGMVTGLGRRMTGGNPLPLPLKILLRCLAAAVAVYGAYAFIKQDIASYLFLQNAFVFFDFEQPAIFFIAENVAMMGLWVFIACYGTRLLQRISAPKRADTPKQDIGEGPA